MRANLGHGRVTSLLPYLLQDRYDRTLVMREHRVAVLENDRLRAEFLLDLGGRLRSLVGLSTGRELLYANPAFQPANLALREAWFAGGVEWNVGIRGHTPHTCAPVFAARVDGPGGVPVLRMWEFGRIREVVYQLDCWLPEGSPALVVAVRIVNPNDHDVPMYWWSNIAVPETEDVRVLAPGDAAWRFDETATVGEVELPVASGRDVTYPAAAGGAADYFVRLEEGRRPWVAAVDGSGNGLVQSSTPELRGRKLFVWGGSTGGRHWQEWLSPLGGRYLEIQAGLLRTQLEHVAMPARAEWAWVETYGAVQADPDVVHGADWAAARDEVERSLTESVSDSWLVRRRQEAAWLAEQPPAELLHTGSGWGALELRHRGGGRWVGAATPFPVASLGSEQAPWVGLLETGRATRRGPAEPPPSYLVSPTWADRLERSSGDDWPTWLHRGVARHHAGRVESAAEAWRRSQAATSNAWALRNLAVVATHRLEAADLLRQATALAPEQPALVAELARGAPRRRPARGGPGRRRRRTTGGHGGPAGAVPRGARGRGDRSADRAEAVFADVAMPWVREGSRSLDDLWFRLETLKIARQRGVGIDEALVAEVRNTSVLPYAYDFRMSAGPPAETPP